MIQLSILVALAGVSQAGAATVQSTAEAPEHSQSALGLAQLMAPRELLASVKLREFDRNFGPTLLLNDDLKSLEAEYPGSLAAMTAGARPLMREQTDKVIVRVHTALSQFLLAEFSASEIASLTAFYGSPSAQHMNQKLAQSVDTSAGYRSMMASDDGKASQAVVGKQRTEAIERTKEKLSDADKVSLMTFARTPAFAKLGAVRPRIRQIITETLNAPDADYEKRVDKAVDEALETHIASIGRKDSR